MNRQRAAELFEPAIDVAPDDMPCGSLTCVATTANRGPNSSG